MKIKLRETQLRRVINELGGYDDSFTMSMHGGAIQGEIRDRIYGTTELVEKFAKDIKSDKLTKEHLMLGVSNLSNHFESEVSRLKELTHEIYLDDDFKSLINSYINNLKKIIKYFRLLSRPTPTFINKQPEVTMGGLGMDMSREELSMVIAENLIKWGTFLEKIGEMFETLYRRYRNRLESNN